MPGIHFSHSLFTCLRNKLDLAESSFTLKENRERDGANMKHNEEKMIFVLHMSHS